MNTNSYLKILGLALLTVIAVLYFAVVFTAVWNTLAPSDLRWLGDQDTAVAAWLSVMLPFFGAFVYVIVIGCP